MTANACDDGPVLAQADDKVMGSIREQRPLLC
jgi:hypothetical protein